MKNKNRISAALTFWISAAAIALRSAFLALEVGGNTVYKENSRWFSAAFFILLIVSVLSAAIASFGKKGKERPFFSVNESPPLFILGLVSGAALLLDFVFRCHKIYDYASGGSGVKLNYFIPLAASCVFALLSSAYFIITGISFKSERYDFRELKLFHFAPFLWALSGSLSELTVFDLSKGGSVYLEEAVQIAAAVFFLIFAASADKNFNKSGLLEFFGFLYFLLAASAVISVIFAQPFSKNSYVQIAFLATGIFAFEYSGFKINRYQKD